MLLALDTATHAVTVAVHDGASVLAESTTVDALRHGELLAPAIAAVLSAVGAHPRDLSRVAVGVGPGPFTGLRVGLVTARTMGAVLGIPVVGVCSLDVLAAAVSTQPPFLVATDARRKEVYWARYDATSGPRRDSAADACTDTPADATKEPAADACTDTMPTLSERPAPDATRHPSVTPQRIDGPHVAAPVSVATQLPVAGRGAVLYPDSFPNAVAPENPTAADLARLVATGAARTLPPEPLYLRRPDAATPRARKPVR